MTYKHAYFLKIQLSDWLMNFGRVKSESFQSNAGIYILKYAILLRLKCECIELEMRPKSRLKVNVILNKMLHSTRLLVRCHLVHLREQLFLQNIQYSITKKVNKS